MWTEVQPVASSSLWNQIFDPYDHSIGPELDLQATKGRFGLRPPSHPLLHRAPWKGPTTKHNITLGKCCYTKNKHILPSKSCTQKVTLECANILLQDSYRLFAKQSKWQGLWHYHHQDLKLSSFQTAVHSEIRNKKTIGFNRKETRNWGLVQACYPTTTIAR